MEPVSYLRLVLVLALVIGLILLAGYLARRYGLPALGGGLRRGGGHRRLRVVETAMVDQRRRLILVARDDTEHLLLVGGGADLVIESAIRPPRFVLPEGLAGEDGADAPAAALTPTVAGTSQSGAQQP